MQQNQTLGEDMSWKYIDKQKAAIQALQDYERMQNIIDSTPQEIKEIENDLPTLRAVTYDGAGIKGSRTDVGEEQILHHLQRVDNRKRKYQQAMSYMNWFTPAWVGLTRDEQRVLEICFLENLTRGQAIDAVMDEFHYEKTVAYNLRKKALEKFTMLLYGK